MRQKIIRSAAILFLLLVGFPWLFTPTPHPPEPPAPGTSPSPSSPSEEQAPGQVAANDEPAESAPYQKSAVKPETQPIIKPSFTAKPTPKKTSRTVVIDNKEYPLRTYRPLATPNDPFAAQWWVSNAKLTQAWDIPRGNHQTLLAVIDTGFALEHEEFTGRWHANSGETGSSGSEQPSALNCTSRGLPLSADCNLIDEDNDGTVDNETGAAVYQNPSRLNCTDQNKPITRDCNHIDDDSNGYIDDVRGWDFINYDNSVQAGELNPSGDGTTHGTLVAGIAAATGDNSKGLAGVDWETKVLPIQALDDDAYGDTLSVGRAILYAAAQGADVISISLGSELPDEYVREAIRKATEAGSIVVAASGNDGCECMVYPAYYPEVVSVGALSSTNQPASFSSWGANLDILAPGTNMTSPTWTAGNHTSAYSSGINGTSFATPMVGGLLTRLLSQQPNASPLQLVAALTESSGKSGLSAAAPHTKKLGYGSLDSLNSTTRLTTARSAIQSYALQPVSRGNYLIKTSALELPLSQNLTTCSEGIVPSTPLFELIKGSSRFFTVSHTENSDAQKAGYTSTLIAHTCVQQLLDTIEIVRIINPFSELRNFYKPATMQ